MATGAKYLRAVCLSAALILTWGLAALNAQQVSTGAATLTPVPRLVWFSGVFRPADGLPESSARQTHDYDPDRQNSPGHVSSLHTVFE